MERWTADGHEVRAVVTAFGEIKAELWCPHAGTNWSKVPDPGRPTCRRAFDEDGEPDPSHAGSYCMVEEYATDERATVRDCSPLVLSATPIAFAWEEETVTLRRADDLAPLTRESA